MKFTLSQLFILLIAVNLTFTQAAPPEKSFSPKVILILADDMGGHLSSMGTPAVSTPFTDQLATEGVMFTNAFSTCASCSPSRSSILTGMYPHSNGHWRNTHTPKVNAPESEFTKEGAGKYDHVGVWPEIPTLTEVLNKEGIYTGLTSKYHLSPTWKYVFDGRLNTSHDPVSYGEAAKKLLNLAEDKSFFLQINVSAPHRPFRGHLKHFKGEMPDINEIYVPPFLADTEEMRKDLQEYYACVELSDQCTGEVLKVLKAAGIYDDALIIATADQGMAYHRAKASAYHAGTHIPMVIKGPGMQKNIVVDELVSLIDLMPTILDYFNIKKPENIQGRSLMQILSGEKNEIEGRDFIFTEHNSHGPEKEEFYPSRAIFDGRYYYIKNLYPAKTYTLPADLEFQKGWGNYAYSATIEAAEEFPEQYRLLIELQENRPPQELYDMENDPGQIHNLAGYPDYEDIRKSLKEELEEWLEMTNDSILQMMNIKD